MTSFDLLDEHVSDILKREGRMTGEEFAYLRKRRAFLCGWEDEQWEWRREDHLSFVSIDADRMARLWEGKPSSVRTEPALNLPTIFVTPYQE